MMRKSPALLLLLALQSMAVSTTMAGPVKNGFDLADALVPASKILSGGPQRDGIPAIDTPRFVTARAASFLKQDQRVLGIRHNGVSKAYPITILSWHEIVNDRFAGDPVAVTYCPLCGTGIAYLAQTGDQAMTFGVSGLLYNSDMLLYDRKTHSLWSQIMRQAVSGPMKTARLKAIPVEHTRWSEWKRRHPGTLVLSTDTGYSRDYSSSPYRGYEESRKLLFPVQAQDDRYHPKETVLGVELDGHFKAYPFVELEQTTGEVHDTLAGRNIVVQYDRDNRSASAAIANGDRLAAVTAFWFAWYAFHPDTAVYRADTQADNKK
ncbi:MAG: DUF3179 domain-containing protein [Gammaproteobacteria bacterium]|nr:DUF3179 domain-containing protein [Gammaproteobacteria bacterium]